MKIFIDSGNISEIQKYKEMGLISGVMTTPEIMGMNGVSGNPLDLLQRIIEVMGEDGYVFVQVVSSDPCQQVEAAEFLSNLGPNMVVKVMMDKSGLKSIPSDD